jgi:acyl carrier protein
MTNESTTTSLPEIEAQVTRILVDQLGLDIKAEDIKTDSSLLDEVGLDSVALIRFAMGLETEFDVEIDDDDLVIENFETTGKVAQYVQGRMNA